MRSWRDHALGFGVAAHLLAITLMALPNPSGALNPAAWRDPTVQAELGRWAGRLAFLGWDRDELQANLWTFATGANRVREAVLFPFKPYYRYCGTWQSWKMFVAPHTHPTRLQIEVERGGRWTLVFRERSDEHAWLREKLDNDRLRSTVFRLGWPQYQGLRRQFAQWVARQAAAWPDATRVRISFVKEQTLSAREVRAGAREPTRTVFPTVEEIPR